MKLRLTESDLKKIIYSTVNKILKEDVENNELLSRIVERLSNIDISANRGENDVEVPLDEEGNVIAFIKFNVDDYRYLTPGMKGADRDVPDDPNNVEGDYNVNILEIVIYDENDQEYQIEDNGMVSDALKDIINLDETGLDFDM